MKQPELGSYICSIRNQKGITQKELAESCNIDIRTLQRIESGNVTPRMSTLKLLAEALSCDIYTFLDEKQENPTSLSTRFLGLTLNIGIIYFFSWLITSPLLSFSPSNLTGSNVTLFYVIIATIYALSGVFFYYGINRLGKHYGNKLLQITSLIIMVCIPLFLISILIVANQSFGKHLSTLVVLIMSINSIFFGIGLFNTKNPRSNWYKLTGILQLIVAPFFLIRTPITQLIGFYMSIPFLLLMITLVLLELRQLN